MSTLSHAIHRELGKIEGWIEELFGKHGIAAPEVKAAIANIRAQANAIDPKLPAATVQDPAPVKGST